MTDTERVVLLTFNDLYVLEQPAGSTHGGFAGLCAMIARERRAALDDPDDPAGAVIVCCCGDFMTAGARLSGRGPQDCGRHMVPLLTEAGVTHVVPGNHEFDRGTHGCALRSAESPFCWLCTNVDSTRVENPSPSVAPGPMPRSGSTGSSLYGVDIDGRDAPFGAGVRTDVVVTRGGRRIGLVGLCTPRAPAISSAGDGGALFIAPEEAFDAVSPALSTVDAVVALTHMDFDEDARLADHTAGRLDVVLGGHEHFVVVDRAVGRPPIVKCGSDADHLGRIVLRIGRGANHIESIDMLPNTIDAARRATPVEEEARTRINALLDRFKAEVLRAEVDPKDMTNDDAVPLCVFPRPTTSTTARSGPCPLADLFCDLLSEADGGQGSLALIQGGALRGSRDYAAGHVFTVGDLRAEMATMSRCAVRLVSGRDLAAAFEHAVAEMPAEDDGDDASGADGDDNASDKTRDKLPAHCRALLHVSAPWRVVYDPRRPVGRRVVEITRGKAPLSPDALYRVIMQQFLARGGDGFHMLADARPTSPPSPIETVFMRRVVADRLLGAASRHPQGVLLMDAPHPPRVAVLPLPTPSRRTHSS